MQTNTHRAPRHATVMIAALMLVLLSTGASAGQSNPGSTDISKLRHKSRVLLIFAPSASDTRYARQVGSLDGKDSSLADRDIVRFDVLQSGASTRGDTLLALEEATALRRQFQVANGQFKVIVIDKDGRRALDANQPNTASRLFAVIDATPLRRYEVRNRKRPDPPAAKLSSATTATAPPRPSKRLKPEQVVKIQMEALQHNDKPTPDAGIATTFDFASPQNKQATGPLDHFALIVKSAAYLPMLNCKSVTYDPIVVDGDRAEQRVHIVAADGTKIAYIFELSRQTEGPFAGCWMNDGCVRDDSEAEKHRFDA